MNIGKRTMLQWLATTLLGSGLGACGGGSEDAPAPEPGSPSPPPPPPPPPSAALYVSPQSLQADTPLDGYTVRATYASGPRDIPILVRHPAGTSGPLPLVLWSHGGDKSNDGKYNNVDWAAALVGAGYIMVSMTHLPRTAAEVDALAAEFGVDATAAGAAARQQFEANVDRPRDAIAVLNDLANIEAAFPALRGRIDCARIGVGGHSRGAYTVRTVSGARVDLAPTLQAYSFIDGAATNQPLTVQIKAVLANSPQGPDRFGFYDRGNGEHSWRDCTLPDLTQTGRGDNTDELAVDRVKPFDLMPAGDKFKMYIDDPNTPHETFNLNNAAQPVFEAYVRSTGLAFLDAYLKGLPEARAYLDSPALQTVGANVATISRR
jgi:hypothetical protein